MADSALGTCADGEACRGRIQPSCLDNKLQKGRAINATIISALFPDPLYRVRGLSKNRSQSWSQNGNLNWGILLPLLFKVQQTQNVTRVQKARVDAWNIPIRRRGRSRQCLWCALRSNRLPPLISPPPPIDAVHDLRETCRDDRLKTNNKKRVYPVQTREGRTNCSWNQ